MRAINILPNTARKVKTAHNLVGCLHADIFEYHAVCAGPRYFLRAAFSREKGLSYNGIDNDGIAMLRACWPGDSGLQIGWQF